MNARLAVYLAVLASMASPALAANQIVVRSSGPSAKAYPVGKQLAVGTQVSLRPGDSLTVLGPSRALVLVGPGRFTMAEARHSDPFSRTRFSARRGPPLPRGPWAVSIDHSGTVCFAGKEKLSLWRPTDDQESTVTISGTGVAPVSLRWSSGAQLLDWPAGLPLDNGAVYRIHVAGRPAPAQWNIAVISPWSLDRAAAAEGLLRNGCGEQLEQLVERTLWEG